MKFYHTSGPWHVRTLDGSIGCVDTADDTPVAFAQQIYVGNGRNDLLAANEIRRANARLIAAAPDMLAALRRASLALAFAAETSDAMKDDYEAVSAAIAKATTPEDK